MTAGFNATVGFAGKKYRQIVMRVPIAIADGTAVDTLALRMTLSEGVFAMLALLPFIFLILTVLLLEASLRKRPEDPLLALLESESGSE